MNSTLSKFMTFAFGAAVGAVTTWWYVKEYYKRIADEEIKDMARYYGERHPELVKEDEYIVREEDLPQEPAAEDIRELAKLTANLGYTDYANPQSTPTESEPEHEPGRFEVIEPEEYDTLDGYDTAELTYYADGVMTDEDEEIVDANEIVGMDPAEHFGEYEDDSVHIRDNKLKIDYEILRDTRTYSERWSINRPHRAEGE